ncbi:hypothetical protein A8990_11430 [Paenibacillus taihuensis]|uniref:Uncharacterized protein n=1 Tax=Paenibacillus taihuensis TaxID=1156355 RepID=A0A3D9S5D3_9BACL|nr:hypothetical protein [Paenibacillus taihuensis]REE84496.1 hypothetical protein A8990_11430 [Paenibacillus taihuensis]
MKFKLPVEAFTKSALVVVYGTGKVAEQYMDQIEEIKLGDKVAFFANTYPSEAKEFRGKPVLSLQQLREHPEKKQWIYVVAAYLDSQPIVDTLREIGIDNSNIVTPKPVEMENNSVYYPLYRGVVKHIFIYPEITEDFIFNDIERRLKWYLPNRSSLDVFISHTSENEQQWRRQLEACDLILVWKKDRLADECLNEFKVKIACVDPEYSDTPEAIIYSFLYFRTLHNVQRKEYLSQSILNFERMKSQFSNIELAYVFGTGPSLEKAWDVKLEPSIKIICNTIVKNSDLVEKIGADILVFSDPLWLSYTGFGEEYRKYVINFLENKKRFCIVPEVYVPLLLTYFPQVKEQLIGIPVISSSFNIPSADSFAVKQTYNVLTRLGLTTASALAPLVYILGCDGIPLTEGRQWEHSQSTPDNDVKDEVYLAHASYFRYNDPRAYYERHYRLMEELLEFGERQGITYRSLAPSYIPALASRQMSS